MTLLITQGLPGSGKTTEARKWQTLDPERRVYTDRDDLRAMLYGEVVHPLAQWKEDMVTAVQHSIILDAFERGLSVAVADTNLREDRLEPLLHLARNWNQPVEWIDLRDVPVQTCIQHDWLRRWNGQRAVGPAVIISMAERYGLPVAAEWIKPRGDTR